MDITKIKLGIPLTLVVVILVCLWGIFKYIDRGTGDRNTCQMAHVDILHQNLVMCEDDLVRGGVTPGVRFAEPVRLQGD